MFAQIYNQSYYSTIKETNYYDLKDMHKAYVDHSLFDELLNCSNHCVEFIYETIIYIYCGRYYSDLLWLSEDLKSCGLGSISEILPYVHYSLWFLQSFFIFFGEAYSMVTPIDFLVSDTHFISATIAQCPSYLVRYHPEIVDYYYNSEYQYLFEAGAITKEILKVDNMVVIDSFISGYILYLSLLLSIYYVVCFYTSLGQSSDKDEASIDLEYTVVCSLAEAEKEIGSTDDMIFVAIQLVYLFGWFFGTYYYFIVSRLPELALLMYSIPGIFYIALSIPTYLSYDYGILYGTYLRGTGTTASLIYELGYDYIAISIFYIRLALQGIRLLIMILTYASFHDYMLFYNIRPSAFTNPSTIFSCSHNYDFTHLVCYYLLISIPGIIVYLMYEIIHLFFVLTSQTVALFAIIFWLFLFLYTFFFMARLENFFLSRRERRKQL